MLNPSKMLPTVRLLSLSRLRPVQFAIPIRCHGVIYRPREGIRSKPDLLKEIEEIQSGKPEDPLKYNIYGNRRITREDLFHYSDRKGGKGYSDYANTIYPDKHPYIYPPLRAMKWYYIIPATLFAIPLFIDGDTIDWAEYHIKRLWKDFKDYNFKADAATMATHPSDPAEIFAPSKQFECSIDVQSEAPKKKKREIGFRERRIIEYENRIRAYSSPDKIFRYFATIKLMNDDNSFDIFMTPEDFVRSLTPGVMQPRRYGLDKFKTFNTQQEIDLRQTDKESIFHWIGDQGLINFGDYLFLMTLLATSPNEFRLAFHVFDINGDGQLDPLEFEKVQELVLSQSNVGQRHRDHVTGAGSFRKTKRSVITKHFFGEDGKRKLNIATFLQFQQDLHRDILKIEFERRDPETGPVGIISEVSFAELLLIHASLSDKKQKRMMKRVRRKYRHMPDKKGVSFDEVNDFFSFLYHIDNVDLALHFYKLAGKSLSKELIQRVARKVTGVEISDTVVDVIITIFDENGDGELSHREFVSIMKKRMQRGLERPKDTGLLRLMSAFYECSKRQLVALTSS